jgi:hypothetical protein
MNNRQQRNANCIVQASQLNGGNLSQFFDLQAMRVVKGQALLPASITGLDSVTPGYVVVNQYDGSALQLGPSDIVISCVLENADPEMPITATDNFLMFLAGVQDPPTYEPATGKWSWIYHQGNPAYIITGVDILGLNVGSRQTIFANRFLSSSPYLVLAPISDFDVFLTSPNPGVNVTLLVLTAN